MAVAILKNCTKRVSIDLKDIVKLYDSWMIESLVYIVFP